MKFDYPFNGVCATGVSFELSEDMTVSQVCFDKGCPGNTIGVASLANGRNIDDLISALKGTSCANRPTSCPDQFAIALMDAKNTIKKN